MSYWYVASELILTQSSGVCSHPKGPCSCMVYTWSLKGFLYHYFGVCVGTVVILRPWALMSYRYVASELILPKTLCTQSYGVCSHPKGPCNCMVYTWALKGFLYHYFGVCVGTVMILRPFGIEMVATPVKPRCLKGSSAFTATPRFFDLSERKVLTQRFQVSV